MALIKLSLLSRVTGALSITEIISWGTLYYSLPVLAPLISNETDWAPELVTLSLTVALIAQAVGAYSVGRLLDLRGPRAVMTSGSALGAIALVVVATAESLATFMIGWAAAGLAMSATLYPPAFAALTRWWGERRVTGLTILTISGGFASTVFAPIAVWFADALGWRSTYLVFAAILAVGTVPLHYFGLNVPWPPSPSKASTPASKSSALSEIIRSGSFQTLVAAFTLAAFAIYASVFAVVPLLMSHGYSHSIGAWALGLIGAGQVLGRLAFQRITHRSRDPRRPTVTVFAGSAIAVALLALVPGPSALLLAISILLGFFRGLYTLLQATAVSAQYPLELYGRLSGLLAAGLSLAQAVAPFGGALLAELLGSYSAAYLVFAILGLAAAVLAAIRRPLR